MVLEELEELQGLKIQQYLLLESSQFSFQI